MVIIFYRNLYLFSQLSLSVCLSVVYMHAGCFQMTWGNVKGFSESKGQSLCSQTEVRNRCQELNESTVLNGRGSV